MPTELAWRMGISEWIRPVTWLGLTNSLKIHSPGRISHADNNTIPAQPFLNFFLWRVPSCTSYIPKLTATISAMALA